MDRSAYAELFAREYMGPMFYYCLKKTGNKNDAEELASDIALAVIHAIANYPPPEHFAAWVWRVAHNRYVRWCKDRCLHREHIAGEDIGEFDIADGEAPEDAVIEAEQYSLLRRELAFVAKEHRELVAAHYLDGIGVSELANQLGMPVGTVKTRLFKARKILKEGMNMAREFGKRSYAPEDVSFSSTGCQNMYPWGAVNRKIPNNILLEANNNPSTAEELAMELGIALPYMEDEIEHLLRSTLLKKTDGGKYITNFFIADKECRLEIYNLKKRASKERAKLVQEAIEANIDEIRELVKPAVSEGEFKWTVYYYTIDKFVEKVPGFGINDIFKRPGGCNWGFIGYEANNLICEKYETNYNIGSAPNTSYGHLAATDLGFKEIWLDRVEFDYLAQLLKNDIKIDDSGAVDSDVWNDISKRFAHKSDDGTVIPDMIVFRDGAEKKMMELIRSHPSAVKLHEQLCELFEEIREVLMKCSNPVLHETINYYVTMFMFGVRGMLINDAVASGVLTVPDDPANSNAGMYLIIK